MLGLVHVYFYIILFLHLIFIFMPFCFCFSNKRQIKKPILFLILASKFLPIPLHPWQGVISGLAKLLFKRSPVQKIEKETVIRSDEPNYRKRTLHISRRFRPACRLLLELFQKLLAPVSGEPFIKVALNEWYRSGFRRFNFSAWI